jgi:hypothetical protein
VLLIVAVAFSAAGATGCGSGKHFAKTRFVLHAGLAFGAFHRYIYKPYRQGAFRAGAPKRKRSIAKALIAAGFTYHEIKQARTAANQDPKLRALGSRLGGLTSRFGGLRTLLAAGGGLAALGGINRAISAFSGRSKAAGFGITERAPPLKGA